MNGLATTLSASEARRNFYTIIDEVNDKFKSFAITRRGRVQAVVVSPEEVESWEETLEIMSDKKLMASIKRGEEDIKKGRVHTFEEVLKKLKISRNDLR